jgi:Glutaredoxin-like domain (DUF836)
VTGIVLTLLSKPGCHLCHELRAVVEQVLPEYAATLQEVDVRDDPRHAPYRLEIPVLLMGDHEVARHRVAAADLRSRLEGLGISRV